MYHHLDAILTEQRLKNREALNFHFDQLHDLELKTSEAEALLRRLSRKISALQDPDAFKQEDSSSNDIEEMDAILTELSTYDKEVEKYRKEIIDLGQDAYKLYSPTCTQVLEQDGTCIKVMKIATAFCDLYWPVLYPSRDSDLNIDLTLPLSGQRLI